MRKIVTIILCLLTGIILHAQSVIKGQVKDTVGNPIPYLQVFLKQDNKAVKEAFTNDSGAYQFLGIEMGIYDIVAGETDTCPSGHTIKEIYISYSEVKFIDIQFNCSSESIFSKNAQEQYFENIIRINTWFSTERGRSLGDSKTIEDKLIVTESLSVRFGNVFFPNGGVYYTLDGSEPTEKSEKYDGFIQIQDEPKKENNEVILKALYIDKDGNKGPVREFKFKLASRKTVDEFIAKFDSIYPTEQKALNDLVIEISETSKTEFEKIKKTYDGVWAYFEKYRPPDVICPSGWPNEMYYVDLPIFDDGRLKKTWWCGGGPHEGKVIFYEAILVYMDLTLTHLVQRVMTQAE